MIIDVFVYSDATESAPFGIASLIEAGKCARLDGIAITDRASSHRARDYMEAGRRADFLVIHGLELNTTAGRVVAYPSEIDDAYLAEDWRSLGACPEPESVLDYFHERGGIVIARDVYNRGEGLKDRVYSIRDSNGRGFDGVDTIAVYRRRIDNELSIEAQQMLGVPACAGSGVFDLLEDMGHCATLFAQQIEDQASFVEAMRAPLHWACALRDLGEACPMGSAPRPDDGEDRRDGGRRNREERHGGRRDDRRGSRRDDRREAQGRSGDHRSRSRSDDSRGERKNSGQDGARRNCRRRGRRGE